MWSRSLPDIFAEEYDESSLDPELKREIREMLVLRLDDHYRAMVTGRHSPAEIVNLLLAYKKAETNTNTAALRRKLQNLNFQRGQRVYEFCDKFEACIRELEMLGVSIDEATKFDTFFNAVGSSVFPNAHNRALIAGGYPNVNYLSFKIMLLQDEAFASGGKPQAEKPAQALMLRKNRKGWKAASKQHQPHQQQAEGPKRLSCYGCGQRGHLISECTVARDGMFFCFKCKKIGRHLAKNCPLKQAGVKGKKNFYRRKGKSRPQSKTGQNKGNKNNPQHPSGGNARGGASNSAMVSKTETPAQEKNQLN